MRNIGGFDFVFFSDLEFFQRQSLYNKIYFSLYQLRDEYPDFDLWFYSLFEKEACLKKEREILLCLFGDDIVGIAILKRAWAEKKICTLRVNRRYQKMSIGKKLIELSLEWLNTEKPLITVHKSKQYEFDKLFKFYDFKLMDVKQGYYSLFNTELSYNGELPVKAGFYNQLDVVSSGRIMRMV